MSEAEIIVPLGKARTVAECIKLERTEKGFNATSKRSALRLDWFSEFWMKWLVSSKSRERPAAPEW
jgi:hypothetical protein